MSVAEQQILRANVAQASSETERREKSDIDRHSRRGTEARGKKKEASHNYHARLVLVSRVNFTPSVHVTTPNWQLLRALCFIFL